MLILNKVMTVTSLFTFLENSEMMQTEEVPKLHLKAKPEISDRITPKSKQEGRSWNHAVRNP